MRPLATFQHKGQSLASGPLRVWQGLLGAKLSWKTVIVSFFRLWSSEFFGHELAVHTHKAVYEIFDVDNEDRPL